MVSFRRTFYLLIGLSTALTHGIKASSAAIPWAPDFASAQVKAGEGHKLVLLNFYAVGCPACELLDNVYKDPLVVKAAEQFIPVRVDYERDGKDLADRYGVYGLPTVLFLDEQGVVQGAVPGAEPAANLAADMNRVAASYHELSELQSQARANPNDATVCARLAALLMDRGREADAEAVIAPLDAHVPAAAAILVPVYSQLAELYLHRNRVPDAAVWCRKIIAASQDPLQLSVAHFNLGVCFERQGKNSDAVSEWNLATSIIGAPKWVRDKSRDAIRKVNG